MMAGKVEMKKKRAAKHPPRRPTERDLFGGKPNRRARFEKAEYAMEAARLIRMMRVKAGLDQSELAARLGVSQPRISTLEQGGGAEGPGYATVRLVAEVCGIDWRNPIDLATESVAGSALEGGV
ncbi:MAG: helix-turn-helix transcriptional regulator [Parvularculaceae bacterium]|nr:helix-turn-helix transcriptional regulator [Parvularculaceae bacterium]